MMVELQRGTAVPPAAQRSEGASAAAAQAGAARAATGPAPALARAEREAGALQALRRTRLLSDAQRLLYLLVRSALPDQLVLANLRAIDLLDLPTGPAALAGDPRLPALLHLRLDCVVCRNDWTPLAALVVDAGPAAEGEPAALLREVGIRFLRFRSDSLPRPSAMRALVLG
jgi:hypothetical protein